MNKADWNAFVEENEQRALTLTLVQRNLISDADQHIDWLESRKRFAEDRLTEYRQLLDAAYHALRSYQFANGSPELAKEIADDIEVALFPKA